MVHDEKILQEAIITAHSSGDISALSELYEEGSKRAASIDEACFLATQAYIYALEGGHANQARLKKFLQRHGRDQ